MIEIRDYYDRYWADPLHAPPSCDPTTPVRKMRLQAALRDLPPKARILDVGCGVGEFADFLAQLGFVPVGLDLSANAVQCARQRFPQYDFRVGGPELFAGEFAGQFQSAWVSEVLEHVFDVYGFLTAVHQCLAPGGRIVLTMPYHGLLKNLVLDFANYARHYQPFGGHIRFFNKPSLKNCLNVCGFSPRKWSGIGRPWPFYKSFFVVAEKTHEPLPRPPANS